MTFPVLLAGHRAQWSGVGNSLGGGRFAESLQHLWTRELPYFLD